MKLPFSTSNLSNFGLLQKIGLTEVKSSSAKSNPARSELDLAFGSVIRDPDSVQALDQLGAALEHCGRMVDAVDVYTYRTTIERSDEVSAHVDKFNESKSQNSHRQIQVAEFDFDPADTFKIALSRALNENS